MRKLSIFLMAYLSITCIHTTTTYAQAYAHNSKARAANKDDTGDGDDENDNKKPKCNSDTASANRAHQRPVDLVAAVYGSLPYLKDDNPAGFTQTYLEAVIWRSPRDCKRTLQVFKTFFLEAYLSSNVEAATAYDSTANKPVYYLNRLDLYQHANTIVNLHEDLLYYQNQSALWKTQLFLDVMASYMRTNVSDTISKSTTSVNSWLLGTNFSASFKSDKNVFGIPISFLLTNEVFWINPISNSYNTGLGFQYANAGDASQPFNAASKHFIEDPHPYYHFDTKISFIVSDQSDPAKANNNNVFIHLGYLTGISNGAKNYYNSYFQAQIGLSIDVIGTITKYSNK